jgi:hypothetical protein
LICAHASIEYDSAVFLPDATFILQQTRISPELYFSVRKETKETGFFIVEHFPFNSILAISPQFARLGSVVCHLSNYLGALVRSRTDRDGDRAYFPPSERFE